MRRIVALLALLCAPIFGFAQSLPSPQVAIPTLPTQATPKGYVDAGSTITINQLTPYLAVGQTLAGLVTAAFDAAPVINAALAAGVSVQLPCGTYTIGGPLTAVARDGARLVGTEGCTVFNIAFAAGDVIHLTGHFQTVRDIAFNATVSHTSGAGVHQDKTSFNVMDRLAFYGLWSTDAMLMDGSNTTFINDFNCSNGPLFQISSFRPGGACIHVVGNAVEVHIKHGLAARFDAGIRVSYGSGVYAEGVDALQNGHGVLFDPGAGQSVFGIQMTNVLGDTSYADNWLFSGTGPISDVQLANCWASSSGTGNGMALTNPTLDGLHISNSLFLGNWGDGLNIVTGKNIVVSGSAAEYNNVTNASAGNGFHLQAGVSRVTMTGNRAGLGGTYSYVGGVTNHQLAGISVEAGAGDYLTFTGNNLVGNIAASMAIGATGPNIKAVGNAGFTEVAGGATQLPTGQTTLAITTGINAPDARIIFMFSPLTSYASCGISGMSSSFVIGNVVTVTASNAPTSPCQFWWRASSWGN